MWSIPDWVPAALFAGFWAIVGGCAIVDLLCDRCNNNQ